jgi:two-component system, cell cycle response regulator CpdR
MIQISPFLSQSDTSLAILLVEDEVPLREPLRMCLEKAGHLVVTASCGREAKELVAERDFDVVITDIVMPDGDGFEVIVELRRRRPQAQIIAISGGGTYLDPLHCLRVARNLGAHQVLMKPFKPDQLLQTVAQAGASAAVAA